MILGAGSASFEILRYLVDRLPVMTTPTWVRNPVQPIAISNVLNYLQGCLEHDEVLGQTFDIGGPDILNYQELFRIYTEEAGLPGRWIIPVPVLTPSLSALWIHLVTPVPAAIARPLAAGLRNPVVCEDNRIRADHSSKTPDLPRDHQTGPGEDKDAAGETCWTDAGGKLPPEWVYCGDSAYAGGPFWKRLSDQFAGRHCRNLEQLCRIGGKNGYFFRDELWRLRGGVDRLLGGSGFRGGRRHPTELRVGDALDFWRVLEVDPERRLLLLAEMKVPGDAVLEFTITPQGPNRSEIRELSRFLPRGLAGIYTGTASIPCIIIFSVVCSKDSPKKSAGPSSPAPNASPQNCPRPAGCRGLKISKRKSFLIISYQLAFK